MNTAKILSVVIPVYNERETVREIVEKVLNLDFVAEIIVVDDGSTDGTRELLEQTKFDERVKRFFTTGTLARGRPCGRGSATSREKLSRFRMRTWSTIRTSLSK